METFHIPVHSLKEKQRREREELIIQAAKEVLLEKGYYETSMDEIAARVGIAKGTIYKHFPGKEDLVFGIFRRDMQLLIRGIDTIIEKESTATASAKLRTVLNFIYTGFFHKHTQLFASIYNGIDMKRLLADKGGCMSDLWESIVSRVKQIFDEGKATGEFNASIPTKIMAFSFFSLFSPKVYDSMLVAEGYTREEIIEYLWQIYINGIASYPSH
jgi:AcrR family transcriptional regulator